MRILICSKYKYEPSWKTVKTTLESRGHTVVTPADIDLELHGHLKKDMSPAEYLESIKRFHSEIELCDALYVLNYEGSFGGSMMLEIGYAAALGKSIIASNSLQTEPSLALFIKEIKKPEEI